MSEFPRAPRDEGTDNHPGEVTRRTLITHAAATAVAATVVTADMPANAQPANANPPEDRILFVLLSAALTGISEGKLATGLGPRAKMPTSEDAVKFMKNLKPGDLAAVTLGSDPVGVKGLYFQTVIEKSKDLDKSNSDQKYTAAFKTLLKIAKDSLGAPDRAQAIIDKVQAASDGSGVKFLARSIVLMWYLGAWYGPKALEEDKGQAPPPAFQVISPEAYTESWALRVARAHPMGFSQLPFGYWTRDPADLSTYIG
jgi:hypothetical protein